VGERLASIERTLDLWGERLAGIDSRLDRVCDEVARGSWTRDVVKVAVGAMIPPVLAFVWAVWSTLTAP